MLKDWYGMFWKLQVGDFTIKFMKTIPCTQDSCPISMRRAQAGSEKGFTRLDLFMVIATSVLLAGVVLPLMANTRPRAEQVTCANNLRQIGQAIRNCGVEHENKPPWLVKRKDGGYAPDSGQVPELAFLVFAFLSDLHRADGTKDNDYLGTPKILVCPSDTVKIKRVASDWVQFIDSGYQNQSVSYFIGLHAFPEVATSWMSGDRNLSLQHIKNLSCSQGANNADGWFSGETLVWTNSIHGQTGNMLLTSGAVLQLSNEGLSNSANAQLNYTTRNVHLLVP
jgi:hypothetical protein